mgnify:CR=1 FL=1
MKQLYFTRVAFLFLFTFFISNSVFSQSTVLIDFEVENQGYTADARCLHLHTAFHVTVFVETSVASKEPLETLSQQCLAAVAKSVKSSKAVLTGSVASVSTSGRFTFQCYGSERVGCCICNVNPMPKQCWFLHAA